MNKNGKKCETCKGHGELSMPPYDDSGICPICEGSGIEPEVKCKGCKGTGLSSDIPMMEAGIGDMCPDCNGSGIIVLFK